MTATRASSSRYKFRSLLIVAAIGVMTACGDRGSSQAPARSAAEGGRKEDPAARCSVAVGRLNKHDMELFTQSGTSDVAKVKQAIDAGGNVNVDDSLKRTPLFAAAFCNHPAVAKLLIDQGGDVNARDFLGMSPLHAAVVVGGGAVANELIAKGADMNVQTPSGFTPLHLAAATNQPAMVELLMERGADSQVTNKAGITAAKLAANYGYPAIATAIGKWEEKRKAAKED